MNTEIAQPHPVDPVIPALNYPAVESSLLAAIALFLIRGLWQEHSNEEKAERELISKLVDKCLDKD